MKRGMRKSFCNLEPSAHEQYYVVIKLNLVYHSILIFAKISDSFIDKEWPPRKINRITYLIDK